MNFWSFSLQLYGKPVLERDAGLGDAGLAIELQGEAPEIHRAGPSAMTEAATRGKLDMAAKSPHLRQRRQAAKVRGLDETAHPGHI